MSSLIQMIQRLLAPENIRRQLEEREEWEGPELWGPETHEDEQDYE